MEQLPILVASHRRLYEIHIGSPQNDPEDELNIIHFEMNTHHLESFINNIRHINNLHRRPSFTMTIIHTRSILGYKGVLFFFSYRTYVIRVLSTMGFVYNLHLIFTTSIIHIRPMLITVAIFFSLTEHMYDPS